MFKKILGALAVLALVLGFAPGAHASKVALCHKTSSATNPTVLISVSDNAVPAQLAEGSTFAVQQSDGSYSCELPPPPPPPDPQ